MILPWISQQQEVWSVFWRSFPGRVNIGKLWNLGFQWFCRVFLKLLFWNSSTKWSGRVAKDAHGDSGWGPYGGSAYEGMVIGDGGAPILLMTPDDTGWHRMTPDETWWDFAMPRSFRRVEIFLNIWDAKSQVIWGDQDTLTPIKGWRLLKLFQFDTKRPPQNRWGKHRKTQSITISVGFSVCYRFLGLLYSRWFCGIGCLDFLRRNDAVAISWLVHGRAEKIHAKRCERRGGLNYVKQKYVNICLRMLNYVI